MIEKIIIIAMVILIAIMIYNHDKMNNLWILDACKPSYWRPLSSLTRY